MEHPPDNKAADTSSKIPNRNIDVKIFNIRG